VLRADALITSEVPFGFLALPRRSKNRRGLEAIAAPRHPFDGHSYPQPKSLRPLHANAGQATKDSLLSASDGYLRSYDRFLDSRICLRVLLRALIDRFLHLVLARSDRLTVSGSKTVFAGGAAVLVEELSAMNKTESVIVEYLAVPMKPLGVCRPYMRECDIAQFPLCISS